MSVQPGQGQRTCQSCGNVVPDGAQYCPSCGERLSRAAATGAGSFEDAIASVLGDESHGSTGGSADSPPVVTEHRAPFEQVSAPPPPPQGWAAPQQSEPSGWVTPAPQPEASGRNRTLWIVLSIFGLITFCCCGAVFVSVAVS